MRKLHWALIVAILFAVNPLRAQENKKGEFRFSAGAEAALPVGDLGTVTSVGLGAFALVDYGISDKLHLQASASYMYFLAKGNAVATFAIVPIKAGAAYYVTEQFSLQGGGGFASYSGGGGLHYYGGLGYDLEKFCLSLLYNGISDNGASIGWAGLRVAYKFGD